MLEALSPGAEVVCVQPVGAPAMTRSWRERRVVTTESYDTIAAVLDDLFVVADDAVLVRKESIVAGMRLLLECAGPVAEPSAALGVAAILEARDRFAGRRVATVVCGGDVDPDAYRRSLRR